jgi:hypothetical protein
MGKNCGEEGSWKSGLVPDEFWSPGSVDSAKFYRACIEHDDCYETLGSSKADCDEAFRKRLLVECDRAYNGILEKGFIPPCYAAAQIYYEAVERAGGDAFRAAQKKAKSAYELERCADRLVFDASHYLASHADLRAAFGTDHAAARQHWIDHGIREGRRSSSVFDVGYYLSRYEDLQNAFATDYQSAIHHWLDHGIGEGRRASAAFDVSHYLNLYPDLQQAFGPTNYVSAIDHWLEYGMQEGRKSAKNFEVRFYLDRYSDLQAAFGSENYSAAVDHWLIHGLKEGRSGAP